MIIRRRRHAAGQTYAHRCMRALLCLVPLLELELELELDLELDASPLGNSRRPPDGRAIIYRIHMLI